MSVNQRTVCSKIEDRFNAIDNVTQLMSIWIIEIRPNLVRAILKYHTKIAFSTFIVNCARIGICCHMLNAGDRAVTKECQHRSPIKRRKIRQCKLDQFTSSKIHILTDWCVIISVK